MKLNIETYKESKRPVMKEEGKFKMELESFYNKFSTIGKYKEIYIETVLNMKNYSKMSNVLFAFVFKYIDLLVEYNHPIDSVNKDLINHTIDEGINLHIIEDSKLNSRDELVANIIRYHRKILSTNAKERINRKRD